MGRPAWGQKCLHPLLFSLRAGYWLKLKLGMEFTSGNP